MTALRPRRPWVKRTLWLSALTLVAGGVWIVVTALLARSHLEHVRTSVQTVQSALVSDNPTDTADALSTLQSDAARAHQLTTGPAWWLATAVPWAGAPLESVRGIAAQVDAVASALPQPADLPLTSLRTSAGAIDVAAVARLAPTVQRLAAAVASARDRVHALPSSTWLSPVDAARDEFAGLLDTAASTTAAADTATRVLPAMLGADGPKRYLVAFENEAEMRGSGGLAGAFAILQTDHGRISIETILPDGAMDAVRIPESAAPELKPAWGTQPFTFFVDGNQSAHFPSAGRVWSAYWKQYSGESLDGVLALDPTTVSYLLEATGGGVLSTGDEVNAGNVVDFTQHDLYVRYPEFEQSDLREQVLVDVARMVSTRLLGGSGSVTSLLKASSRAATEGRLLVWSADPAVQEQLAGHRIAGVIPETPAPYSQVVVNNAAGGKLDWYLDRAISVVRSGCGEQRAVTVTVKLTNTAPSTGLGAYLEALPTAGLPPGGNRLYVDYVATRGAELRGVDLDGKPVASTAFTEHGDHPFFREKVTVLSGQTVTLVYHLTEPATGALHVVVQPGVRPVQLVADDRKCN